MLYHQIMYLKILKRSYKGTQYKYAVLEEGFRKKGIVSKRIVRNLGPVHSGSDEEKYKKIAERIKQGKAVVSLEETNSQVLEYGVVLVVQQLWERLGFEGILRNTKASYDLNNVIRLLIAHRLHHYGSKNISELEALRWINEEAYHSGKVELQYLYRSLFLLIQKKDEIEMHLCRKYGQKKEIVFYDLTSSYLEGEYENSNIVEYGYNRDKKIGKEQIVIGLLLCDDLPIAHKVWAGNTADKSTLEDAVSQLNKLGIKRFIFVADRGLITEDNIKYIESKGLEYIIATKRRKDNLIKKLIVQETSEKVKKVLEDNGRVYYLCFNEKERKKQLAELEEIKKHYLRKLSLIKSPTEHKVLEALGEAKRIFTFSFKGGFRYAVDKDALEFERQIAGKYVLVTNNRRLKSDSILSTYKQLAEIEHYFRQAKSFESMRPIFHKTDKGILGHVFLSFLSLLVDKVINKSIKDMTTRQVITELKKIKLSVSGDCLVRTDLSDSQKRILRELGVDEPCKII